MSSTFDNINYYDSVTNLPDYLPQTSTSGDSDNITSYNTGLVWNLVDTGFTYTNTYTNTYTIGYDFDLKSLILNYDKEEILDNIDIKEIEQYLRKKKMNKLKELET